MAGRGAKAAIGAAGKRTWNESKPKRRADPTAFQWRVYNLISTIPPGKVASYGEVARAIGSSARAVGNALRNNPFAPKVPCHRIVASTREMGGFDGQSGPGAPKLLKKHALLESEGVRFEPLSDASTQVRVATSSMHVFDAEEVAKAIARGPAAA